jgi:hypothetical protein
LQRSMLQELRELERIFIFGTEMGTKAFFGGLEVSTGIQIVVAVRKKVTV